MLTRSSPTSRSRTPPSRPTWATCPGLTRPSARAWSFMSARALRSGISRATRSASGPSARRLRQVGVGRPCTGRSIKKGGVGGSLAAVARVPIRPLFMLSFSGRHKHGRSWAANYRALAWDPHTSPALAPDLGRCVASRSPLEWARGAGGGVRAAAARRAGCVSSLVRRPGRCAGRRRPATRPISLMASRGPLERAITSGGQEIRVEQEAFKGEGRQGAGVAVPGLTRLTPSPCWCSSSPPFSSSCPRCSSHPSLPSWSL
jgi:hypothetical protein